MKVEEYNLLSYQGKFPIPWKVESLHVTTNIWLIPERLAWKRRQVQSTYGPVDKSRLGDTLGNVQECQINKGSTRKYRQELPPEGMEAPEPWNRGSDRGQ
jgi:hypothetical protein